MRFVVLLLVVVSFIKSNVTYSKDNFNFSSSNNGPDTLFHSHEEDEIEIQWDELEDEEYPLLLGDNTPTLNIDSILLSLQDYYKVWDSKKVNPYKIDGKKFKDSLSLTLFDTTSGLHWAAPIQQTDITSNFGRRGSRWHYGIDLKLTIGDPIKSAFDGIVRIASFDWQGYGYYVLVRHKNGLETLYGHLSEIKVSVGQVVKAGEIIGLGGNTGRSSGPHLHFEVRYQGNAINPVVLYDFKSAILSTNTLTLTSKTFDYLNLAKSVRAYQKYHKVRRGDTLSAISRRYHVPITKLYKLNRLRKGSVLKVGKTIRVS